MENLLLLEDIAFRFQATPYLNKIIMKALEAKDPQLSYEQLSKRIQELLLTLPADLQAKLIINTSPAKSKKDFFAIQQFFSKDDNDSLSKKDRSCV